MHLDVPWSWMRYQGDRVIFTDKQAIAMVGVCVSVCMCVLDHIPDSAVRFKVIFGAINQSRWACEGVS